MTQMDFDYVLDTPLDQVGKVDPSPLTDMAIPVPPRSKGVIVIGDKMADAWVNVKQGGVSAEAPIVRFFGKEYEVLPGGAGNVARGLAKMGVKTYTNPHDSSRPYPTKVRFVEDGVQVFRVDLYDICDPLPISVLEEMFEAVEPTAIVISDYGKGTIHNGLVNWLTQWASSYPNVPFFIDTKGDPSVWDDIPRRVFFPNIEEYMVWKDCYVTESFIVLKRGADGVSLITQEGVAFSAPSVNLKPKSVCGAGDVVLASIVHDLTYPEVEDEWPLSLWETALENAMECVGIAMEGERTCCAGY
jgi:bifunctional ADP-heptose synthase (sugar kinase/adenylyltransferase)